MKTFEGKVAIITGGARGIGRATGECLSKYGAKVALVDRDEKAFTDFKGDLKILADVSKPKDVQKMVGETASKFKKIDILVNCAGILRDSTLLKMTEEQYDQVIAVNLKGTYLCAQACAKLMVEKKYGKIVNIASTSARGNFGQSNYSASKAGVIGMTKTWALELSRYNINVNAIAPGLIATDMTATIPKEIKEKMIAMIPLKRQGEAHEVAELIAFLASDASSYIQGQVIGINGGFQI